MVLWYVPRFIPFVKPTVKRILTGNFLSVTSIKASNELVSATKGGRTGFVSEDDIADVAVDLLTAPKLGGAEPIIVGPELLSYDDVRNSSVDLQSAHPFSRLRTVSLKSSVAKLLTETFLLRSVQQITSSKAYWSILLPF